MALNIKNPQVDQLAKEVARLARETKTEAVRRALQERKERLSHRVVAKNRTSSFMRYLEEEVWPLAPHRELGRRLSKRKKDEILGYGPEGV